MTVESYSIAKGKNLLEEIIKIAEREQLFHAQIVGGSGRLKEVEIIPTNFKTRDIDKRREFEILRFDAVIKKTQNGFTAAPVKATLQQADNMKVSIDGELRAATTAGEVTVDISKHDLSKIIQS